MIRDESGRSRPSPDSSEQASGKRVSSAEVARAAGVSRTTVSFVLNETAGQTIPAETRERVLAAAARLNYSPSPEARRLRRGTSDVVLLYLAPELPLSADFGMLLEQMSAAFAETGLVLVAHPWATRPDAEAWRAVTPAAVVTYALDEPVVDAMRRNGVRAVVSLTGGADPVGRWVVGARELELAAAQVGRLADAGHTRLAYAMPHSPRLVGAGRLRRQALQQVCAARGLPAPLAEAVPIDVMGAAQVVAGWQRERGVSAVCAHDDITALAVLAGMRELGLDAPGGLAVIGVNDTPAAALAQPALTMVAADAGATARYVVDVVTALLRGEDALRISPPSVASVIERRSV